MQKNIFIAVMLMVLSTLLLTSTAHSVCGDGILEDEEILYGGNGAGGNLSQLYIVDPSDGSIISTIGDVGFAVTGLAMHPDTGVLYGSTGGADPSFPGHLIMIDTLTGEGTLVGDINPSSKSPAADITFAPDGTLYGWQEGDDDLITIDLSTGEGTIVADSGLDTFGSGLAALDNTDLYFSGDGDDGDLSIINAITGQEDVVIPLGGTMGVSINAMAFNDAGELYGVRDLSGSELIRIDTLSGDITLLGPGAPDADAIVFSKIEECDDGNTDDGDGCSSACEIEGGGVSGTGSGSGTGTSTGTGTGTGSGGNDDGGGCSLALMNPPSHTNTAGLLLALTAVLLGWQRFSRHRLSQRE